MSSRHGQNETRPSLILRVRDANDMVAWQEFVEIYQPLIQLLARRHGLQEADTHDVVQEVFTRVLRHVDQWNPHESNSSFRGWLATITRNQTIQFFRETSRRPKTGVDSQLIRITEDVSEQAFDLEQERQLFQWAARRIQHKFHPVTWQSFWLTAVEEQSVADVAKRLNTTVAQVYVARSRVMKLLKSTIARSQFESGIDWRRP